MIKLFMKLFVLLTLSMFVLSISAQTESNDSIKKIELNEFVVTATKTERDPREIPARISIINASEIENTVIMQVDDIIRYTPGVNINRSTGIYSMRPMVTLRGLSGDEQSRTLVLVNGVPVNTSDEGGVNWNRFNQYDIERIEIFRGPGSSLYGNNAMGGVINIITKNPEKPQEVNAGVSYGTYNTFRQDLNLRLRNENGYYGTLSQYYIQSDGYINVPDSNRTQFDIARYLESVGVSARIGNDQNQWFNWELQYDIYRDKRGEGYQIYTPDGCYRNFHTNLIRGQLKGSNAKTLYHLNLYYQLENYYDVNEQMRTIYSRYDVNSFRKDYGLFFNLNREILKHNTLTTGFEYKIGSVHGGDYYQTEPYDTVLNAGMLTTLAGYIQDEHSFLNEQIIFVGGVRYDYVTFSDGKYYTTNPWNTIPELVDHSWAEVSPRAGLRFNFFENLSGYLSYSHGFRASILDDLTRTGWMWVGPKYANPELEPESINNYEIGADLYLFNEFKLSMSAYVMLGDDFLYYVSTGDSLFGRPIFRRENVTNVLVKGIEAELDYHVTENIQMKAGYTYADSRITSFEERPELEDNKLKFVPLHNASLSIFWKFRFFNISGRAIYKGSQFGDDVNQIILDDYASFDLMISKTIRDKFTVSFEVQNLFNEKHMETIDYISPGRLLSGRIVLKI